MASGKEGAWHALALSLALGAAYDLAFAVVILFFPSQGATWLGLPLPHDLVYLRLNGIFLLMLAGFYMLPALDPRRYQGIVGIAVAGRALGFLYLGGVWLAGRPTAFLALALGDLFFAVVHGLLLGLARGSNRGKC
jgi:hypothetical protein